MRQNVTINGLAANVEVAELNWCVVFQPLEMEAHHRRGSSVPRAIPLPDMILAADCVYFEPAFPLLVQTLADLTLPTTDVLFCYKKRRKVFTKIRCERRSADCMQADKRFFTMLKKAFSWTEVCFLFGQDA